MCIYTCNYLNRRFRICISHIVVITTLATFLSLHSGIEAQGRPAPFEDPTMVRRGIMHDSQQTLLSFGIAANAARAAEGKTFKCDVCKAPIHLPCSSCFRHVIAMVAVTLTIIARAISCYSRCHDCCHQLIHLVLHVVVMSSRLSQSP